LSPVGKGRNNRQLKGEGLEEKYNQPKITEMRQGQLEVGLRYGCRRSAKFRRVSYRSAKCLKEGNNRRERVGGKGSPENSADEVRQPPAKKKVTSSERHEGEKHLRQVREQKKRKTAIVDSSKTHWESRARREPMSRAGQKRAR